MPTLHILLLLVAVICFLLAAFGVTHARFNILAFGLAAFAGAFLVP